MQRWFAKKVRETSLESAVSNERTTAVEAELEAAPKFYGRPPGGMPRGRPEAYLALI